ncbi:MAG TPA: DNA repair protein RecO [Treponema sp.]|nr:DNA repair protein RecO [Treponema sp.]
MTRTSVYEALILRARPSGESNREIWMLTAEEGILRAMVFGGPKSRLRSHAAPFHSGRVWVYYDPVRDSRKLSDFDVVSWRPGLRELYERAMSADAIAETVLASHGGGGNWEAALAMTGETLDVIAEAGEELCVRVVAHFFWRWAGMLGIEPDLNSCASCGKKIPPDQSLRYSNKSGSLYCASCAGERINLPGRPPETFFPVNGGCRRWLENTAALPPSRLERVSLDAQSLREAKALTQSILAAALGKRLSSWDW